MSRGHIFWKIPTSLYEIIKETVPAFLDFVIPCRFVKKKEEKKEAKAAQQKTDLLSDHELQRMKDERERWVRVCVG